MSRFVYIYAVGNARNGINLILISDHHHAVPHDAWYSNIVEIFFYLSSFPRRHGHKDVPATPVSDGQTDASRYVYDVLPDTERETVDCVRVQYESVF